MLRMNLMQTLIVLAWTITFTVSGEVSFSYGETCYSEGDNMVLYSNFSGTGTLDSVEWFYADGDNTLKYDVSCGIIGSVPNGFPDGMVPTCPNNLGGTKFELSVPTLVSSELNKVWGAAFTFTNGTSTGIEKATMGECDGRLVWWKYVLIGLAVTTFTAGHGVIIVVSFISEAETRDDFEGFHRKLINIGLVLSLGSSFITLQVWFKCKECNETDEDENIRNPFLIPQEDYKDIKFEEVLTHNFLKRVEQETGVKVKMYGKGSNKYGKYGKHGKPLLHQDKPLQASINSDDQGNVKKALDMIKAIINDATFNMEPVNRTIGIDMGFLYSSPIQRGYDTADEGRRVILDRHLDIGQRALARGLISRPLPRPNGPPPTRLEPLNKAPKK